MEVATRGAFYRRAELHRASERLNAGRRTRDETCSRWRKNFHRPNGSKVGHATNYFAEWRRLQLSGNGLARGSLVDELLFVARRPDEHLLREGEAQIAGLGRSLNGHSRSVIRHSGRFGGRLAQW